VVVVFFGDGAIAQGSFHEAVNLAALWQLPVIFLCENNGYAEFSTTASQHPVPIAERSRAYGIPSLSADGNNVLDVAATVRGLVRGHEAIGPVLVEAVTRRVHGHYEGDQQRYRSSDERATTALADPIAFSTRLLEELGMTEARRRGEDEIEAELNDAIATARSSAAPNADALFEFVIADRPLHGDERSVDSGEVYRMMDALHDALDHELAMDPTVFLAGIDVGEGGNVFGITRGLYESYPDRVLDTPISETALMGLGVGGAMAGCKPVVELMYFDFIGVCFDQILNQAAKLHFMTGGHATMPLVVRTQFGAGRSSGAQHSQSLEALLAHIPGLTVIMPSNPADAYGLLRSAIRDPNPVLFIEHRLQYGKKGPRPQANHLVPIGVACRRRSGDDLTIVSWSRMVDDVVSAADLLAEQNISADVIDLRTIVPLDEDTVFDSVAHTGRILIVHEAIVSGGFGAEIAARIADRAFWHLDAPVRRLGPPAVPNPYAPSLEREWLPGVSDIVEAALQLVAI
jgi:2-oxoisovalerate dehydrogenase E1 component